MEWSGNPVDLPIWLECQDLTLLLHPFQMLRIGSTEAARGHGLPFKPDNVCVQHVDNHHNARAYSLQ